jgi:IS30 family transposase
MKPAQKYVHYTVDDIQTISRMNDEGHSAREIAEVLGRSAASVSVQIAKIRKGQRLNIGKAETPVVTKVVEMTPREMIKRLYNLGYRIENNTLVCYTKQVVKLNDIINAPTD